MSKALGLSAVPPIRTFLVGEALGPLQQMLALSSDIEISGTAKNGSEALELIPHNQAQVICTELEMSGMDGLELTRDIMATEPRAILVICRLSQTDDREKIFQLFEAGALEVFPLPDDDSEQTFYASAQELIKKIKILAGVMVLRRRQNLVPTGTNSQSLISRDCSQSIPGVIVIGASTGGPHALQEILTHLPGDVPFPLVCVQHMSPGFLESLVNWLAVGCALSVTIAEDGELPQGGTVYFPPEGRHLTFDANGRFLVVSGTKADHHIPSITVSFQSAACRFGRHVIGVLLTGMGEDGADGMLAIADHGGITIAQNEQSCVVFGMPQRAIEIKAASHILPLQDIASMLMSVVSTHTMCGIDDGLTQEAFTNNTAMSE